MVLYVSDDFGQLLNVSRLKIDQIKGEDIVLKRPEVHSKLIRRQEVLAIWRHTHSVDVIVVAELKLLPFRRLITFINTSVFWHDELAVRANCALTEFFAHLEVKLPQFNDSIVRRQHLQYTLLIIHKLDGINFLIELDRFEMVKLRLMGLDLRKVPVVEISGVLKLIVLEYDDSTSLISDRQILACLVVGDCSK